MKKAPVIKKVNTKVNTSLKKLKEPALTEEEMEMDFTDVESSEDSSAETKERINQVVEFVFNHFNLQGSSDYRMDSYTEKDGKVKISLSNPQFSVAVTINDRSEHPELL